MNCDKRKLEKKQRNKGEGEGEGERKKERKKEGNNLENKTYIGTTWNERYVFPITVKNVIP